MIPNKMIMIVQIATRVQFFLNIIYTPLSEFEANVLSFSLCFFLDAF